MNDVACRPVRPADEETCVAKGGRPPLRTELEARFAAAFADLGLVSHQAQRFIRRGPEVEVLLLCGRPHEGWRRTYERGRLDLSDPVLSELLRAPGGFFWSELAERRGRLTRGERHVLEAAAELGLNSGVGFSAHHPDGTVTAACAAGRDFDAAARGAEALALASSLERAARDLPRPARRSSTYVAALRSRQAECLGWAAAGKTSTEIGLILGLSRKTVDEHIENACRALDVIGRTQAVARAIDLGLIRSSRT